MFIATLRLELRINDCPTLRQKRRCLEGIMVKLHRHFNVSVAEVDGYDRVAESVLGVAVVGGSRREAREVLDRVADAIVAHPRTDVLKHAIVEL